MNEQGRFFGELFVWNLTSRRRRFMHLAAGTIDGAPDLRIAFHAHVASKADWYEIADAATRRRAQQARLR